MARQIQPGWIIGTALVTAVVSSAIAILINFATEMKTWWLWLAVIVVTLAGAGFSAWFTARDADSLRVTDPSPELDAGEVDLSGRAKLMPLEDTQIRVKRRLKMADDAELRMQEKRPKPDPGPGTP